MTIAVQIKKRRKKEIKRIHSKRPKRSLFTHKPIIFCTTMKPLGIDKLAEISTTAKMNRFEKLNERPFTFARSYCNLFCWAFLTVKIPPMIPIGIE